MFTLYKSKPKTVFRRVYTYKLEAKKICFSVKRTFILLHYDIKHYKTVIYKNFHFVIFVETGFFRFLQKKKFFRLFVNYYKSIIYKPTSRAGVPYLENRVFKSDTKIFLLKILEIGKTVL